MEKNCTLCPVSCRAEREIRAGACGGTDKMVIAKYGLHPFEEPCISYKNGSGTIFFSGCALRCVFCQNFEISRSKTGRETDEKGLVRIIRELEERGAENINLVTAAHYIPALVRAFELYRPKIPVVYNTHSYEKTQTLALVDKYIDVYLPDLKYFSPKISVRYTGKSDYFEYAIRAVQFMSNRTPDVKDGKMFSGCIVRHLVLPLCQNDSIEIVKQFASLHSKAYFSLMGQYTPCGEIDKFPELKRRLTRREYEKVCHAVEEAGLENVFIQELSSADEKFIPDFSEKTDTLF